MISWIAEAIRIRFLINKEIVCEMPDSNAPGWCDAGDSDEIVTLGRPIFSFHKTPSGYKKSA
jgi:hypothetical protein